MAVGFRARTLWFAGVVWVCALSGSALASSVLAGCGGQVQEEDAQTEPEESDGSVTEDDGSGDDVAEEPGPGDLRLGECELGPSPDDEAGPCNWLAKDRCYDTKAAACACICPRDGPSVCSSGFYGGEDSRTRVLCR